LGGDFPGNPDPDKASWRIVDDADAGVAFNGKWENKYCANGEQVCDMYHLADKGAKAAVYPLPVDSQGRYRLYGRTPYHWDVIRPSSTAVTVESGGAKTAFKWDQTQRMGEWIDLGAFNLSAGARLVIDPENSEGMVIADGFAIVPEK
jgi:hypothetical protein